MGGGWVDTILTGLFVFIGMIMTFFILLQEGKGGGLAALGGTKAAGVEGVTNPIRRATAYLAGLFFILAIILGVMHKPKESIGLGSETPAAIVPAPAAGGGAALNPANPAPNPNNVITIPPAKVDTEKKPDGEAPKTDVKPVEGAKTDAPKTGDKPVEAPKTDATKPAETPKTDTKPVETPKADATKPVEAPKTDAAKPAEEPKKADK